MGGEGSFSLIGEFEQGERDEEKVVGFGRRRRRGSFVFVKPAGDGSPELGRAIGAGVGTEKRIVTAIRCGRRCGAARVVGGRHGGAGAAGLRRASPREGGAIGATGEVACRRRSAAVVERRRRMRDGSAEGGGAGAPLLEEAAGFGLELVVGRRGLGRAGTGERRRFAVIAADGRGESDGAEAFDFGFVPRVETAGEAFFVGFAEGGDAERVGDPTFERTEQGPGSVLAEVRAGGDECGKRIGHGERISEDGRASSSLLSLPAGLSRGPPICRRSERIPTF
jgi:hypothetical protein